MQVISLNALVVVLLVEPGKVRRPGHLEQPVPGGGAGLLHQVGQDPALCVTQQLVRTPELSHGPVTHHCKC